VPGSGGIVMENGAVVAIDLGTGFDDPAIDNVNTPIVAQWTQGH